MYIPLDEIQSMLRNSSVEIHIDNLSELCATIYYMH